VCQKITAKREIFADAGRTPISEIGTRRREL
jgi:hypothetical protein